MVGDLVQRTYPNYMQAQVTDCVLRMYIHTVPVLFLGFSNTYWVR